ncbi:hypothetical protein [Actinoplanes sp. L3-i22]|uniref:hypothetical protein n=1 Tax=Actinoplanes sp. L3-i22 TaxID=2836373 RepID=UPI001C76E1B6|nr:hypothetical protein [Actinoplanes sp. L3-i22]BCY08609.1 hypothetical protein L3i22_036970 [Actinoplanes sp. L3-i22]
MTEPAKRAVPASRRKPAPVPDPADDRLPALRWHIERYDRMRASTASRAAVVLSAGAILSAGNAVVLAQILNGGFDRLNRWLVALFALVVLASVGLVVRALLQAASSLVTPRPSAAMFSEDQKPPPALLFNGTYTAAVADTYDAFRAAVAAQTDADRVEAAQVELYFGIRQHRHRYTQLRAAVRSLKWAATVLLVVLAIGAIATVAGRF